MRYQKHLSSFFMNILNLCIELRAWGTDLSSDYEAEALEALICESLRRLGLDSRDVVVKISGSELTISVSRGLPYTKLRYISRMLLDVAKRLSKRVTIEIGGRKYSVEQLLYPCTDCIFRFLCSMFRRSGIQRLK